ncbi:hypothetical protein AAVH_17570 [Aphelenchoides avenae]|nr:hypothetical protein AAVH_17570 [Aphelenchus avenae]
MHLQDDPFVDVLLCLCRGMLDALELTNRRLSVLVQKRAKGVCLRPLDVAELYADGTYGPPHFVTTLVTRPIRRRDSGVQRETITLEDATPEEMYRWFVNRLRHSVVADELTIAVRTDSPDLLESVKGTVFLKKGLCWSVQHVIDLDNAYRFLSSFIGLNDVRLSVEVESFRFTDDWFKLFEALSVYNVRFIEPTCAASIEALISFVFGASSVPGSENRILRSSFEWKGTKKRKAAAEQLIEAAISCISPHKTTLLVQHDYRNRHDTDHLRVLAKYKDHLLKYTAGDTISSEHDEGQDFDGSVFNFRKERFRIQVFCYPGGLQIRRAPVDEVEDGFFPAWLQTATAQ